MTNPSNILRIIHGSWFSYNVSSLSKIVTFSFYLVCDACDVCDDCVCVLEIKKKIFYCEKGGDDDGDDGAYVDDEYVDD